MSLKPEPHSAQTPAHGAEGAHSVGRTHAIVAVILAVLTIIAFVGVGDGLLPSGLVLPVLLFLALVQIGLQVMFYMRLRWDSRKFAMVFASGVGLAVLIVLAVKVLLTYA